jgi:hypothetical protein
LSKRFTSKNPSTPQGKRGRLRKKDRKTEGKVIGQKFKDHKEKYRRSVRD